MLNTLTYTHYTPTHLPCALSFTQPPTLSRTRNE